MNAVSSLYIILAVLSGLCAGAALAWMLGARMRKSACELGRAAAGEELIRAQERLAARSGEIAAAEQRVKAAEQALEESRNDAIERAGENSALQATIEQERKNSEEKLTVLMGAREQLKAEFQNLASQILEEKSARFASQNKENLEMVLKPLRDQLVDFRKKVEDVYVNESKDRASLSAEINQLKQINQRISEDAVNLANALKGDSKTQGNWGQLALERVLEMSGLEKGREYEVQVHAHDEEGNRFLPDVIVRLPEKRDVIIDSKVSLTAYERYFSAETGEEKEAAMKAHLISLRQHITELSEKKYHDLKEVRALDFVLMFIPVEAAFITAIKEDNGLFREAFEKNIIMVCPSTLLVTLRTIANIWRYERQNQNAVKIAKQAAALHDKFVSFVDTLEEVGRALKKASDSYEEAYRHLSSGRGNLVRRAEAFKALGVRTGKSLPQALLESAIPDEEVPGIDH
ncbi:MAG: DNA recombination protein RmuC [Chitinispirillaceae bacterium]|nr:DNA recombination protein RmuC [Chitinispirillaceae bacterium]